MKSSPFPLRLLRWFAFLLVLATPVLALPPDGPVGTDSGEDDRPVGSLPIVTRPGGPDLPPINPTLPGVSVSFPTPKGGTVRLLGPNGQPVGPTILVPRGARAVRVDLPGGTADGVAGIILVSKHGKAEVVWTR
jgi:hypothetical protein